MKKTILVLGIVLALAGLLAGCSTDGPKLTGLGALLVIVLVFLWIFPAVMVGYVASQKGRSGWGWFWISVVFSWIFGLIFVAVLPRLERVSVVETVKPIRAKLALACGVLIAAGMIVVALVYYHHADAPAQVFLGDKDELYSEAEIAEVGSALDRDACPGGIAGESKCDLEKIGYWTGPESGWFVRRVDLGGARPAYVVHKRDSCGNRGCTQNLIVREARWLLWHRWTVLAAEFGAIDVVRPIVNGRPIIGIEGADGHWFNWNGSRYVAVKVPTPAAPAPAAPACPRTPWENWAARKELWENRDAHPEEGKEMDHLLRCRESYVAPEPKRAEP